MTQFKVTNSDDVLITLTDTRALKEWKIIKETLKYAKYSGITADFSSKIIDLIRIIEQEFNSENLIDEL